MPEVPAADRPANSTRHLLLSKLLHSRIGGLIANFPPTAWMIRSLTRSVARSEIRQTATSPRSIGRVAGTDLQMTLDEIVYDVVEVLGYAVAMVATYEKGDTLPSRAFYIDPKLASMEQVRQWEAQVARFSPDRPISITNPDIAKVYVQRDEYQANLSVQAARSGKPMISDEMYQLFVPIAPHASRPIVDGIQRSLGIEQIIAVPFFLETSDTDSQDGRTNRELVGNLFAMKRGQITEEDVLLLSAFGRQAAVAILSERQRLQIEIAQKLVFQIQKSLQSEVQILCRIAEGVVTDLGYVGCMVASYENDGSLVVRAFSIDPTIASMDQVRQWEAHLSRFSPDQPLSLDNPAIARVYIDRPEYQENLSVQAARAGKPVVAESLYQLFVPVVPALGRPIVEGIQTELGIQQVIAAPFFLETSDNGSIQRELVGNLFAFTRSSKFSSGEIALLQAFGQQAAVGLRNARLYRQSEDRRTAAQMFGKMAFSAATSVHALKNHLGAIRLNLQMVNMAIKYPDNFPEQARADILQHLEPGSALFERLDQAADMLHNLHEPWRQTHDEPTDVNVCLSKALRKVLPEQATSNGVHVTLTEHLPIINASPDMLTEAFKVLIKNAVEATSQQARARQVNITSCLQQAPDASAIVVTIRDNGTGIRPEDLSRVFEMRWTTKTSGLGFGLFWTKDYIEGMGGQIHIESIWQEGTTFEVVIPLPAEA